MPTGMGWAVAVPGEGAGRWAGQPRVRDRNGTGPAVVISGGTPGGRATHRDPRKKRVPGGGRAPAFGYGDGGSGRSRCRCGARERARRPATRGTTASGPASPGHRVG
ncbi:hypothetical protein GCM10012275_54180 [Longimycelium tulufanense]|uniref:Uncharacterized protein n=1 Tax=Longimycelium tulufanense TaxID=907463 RepID=A0A8J3CJK5_9PSEU|nr:hypothetical protein GCM10012275_54180 [Longimycelium tulufanense]